MTHAFARLGVAAQHCAELTERGPRPEEREALLDAWRRDAARLLAEDLSGLLAGERLQVRFEPPELLPGSAVLARVGPVAANCLLRCGAAGETALLTCDFGTALALTDRSFGGEGRGEGDPPSQLPRSAALLIDEIAGMVAAATSRAAKGDDPLIRPQADGTGVIARSENAARLRPFAPDAHCAVLALVIADAHGREWRMMLGMERERLDRLLADVRPADPGPEGRSALARGGAARRRADSAAAPFGDIPLPLHAVLAEFDLPLARLQALAPGDRLPLAPARRVPLRIGDEVLAHGSIGTFEDRIALRLSRLSEQGPSA